MKYLLDTNACIRYISGRSPLLMHKLRAMSVDDIVVCSVVKAELFYGSMKSTDPQASLATKMFFLNQFVSLPFDDAAAQIFAEIRSDLARKGTPIGPYDLQIAAIAIANQVTLVTHNTNEFARVPGLKREDWEI